MEGRFYLDVDKLYGYSGQLTQELEHIRTFKHLVENCKLYDTMHQKELNDIYQRLERMELNLVKLIDANEEFVVQFKQLDNEMRDSMLAARNRATKLFE